MKTEAPVVVFSTNTIPDTTKPTQSGMTPLTELVGAHIGQDSAAVKALVEMDVKPISTARKIVAERGEKLVLDWVAAVKGKYADTSKKGAAAFLVGALGGDEAWDLPPAYLAARRDKARRAEQAAEEKRRAEQIKLAAQTERQETEERQRRWDALTPAQQAKIEDQAREDLADNPIIRFGPGKEVIHKRCLELVMRPAENTMDKAA